MFKKSKSDTKKPRVKRLLSRGVGAGVDLAPVGRLKKLVLKLKARRTSNKVVDAGPTDAPTRARMPRAKKASGDRAGAARRTIGAKMPPAKKAASDKKDPAKQRLKQNSTKKVTASKKNPAKKVTASKKNPAKKVTVSKKNPAKKIRKPQSS